MKFRDVFLQMKKVFEGSNSHLNSFIFLFAFLSLIMFNNCNENSQENNKLDFSYYHTSQIIDESLSDLKLKCPGYIKEKSANDFYLMSPDKASKISPLLKFYDITSPFKSSKKKDNIFLLAGEHPREMISSETMFAFIKFLCEKKDSGVAKKLLEANNFRIIVNANPKGRMLVEQGDYCKRTNGNDVDINRNWDYYFGKDITMSEENSGQSAFSEIETKFILDTIKDFSAKLFLTLHSGTIALFHPYAYLLDEGKYNSDKMKEILGTIKKKYCSTCDLGAPSKLIGYKSSGTCLDYIYDKLKVPYSLAWEIFTNEREFVELKDYLQSKTKNDITLNSIQPNPSRFKQINLAKQIDELIKRRKELQINDSFLEEKEEIKYEKVTFFRKNANANTNNVNESTSKLLVDAQSAVNKFFMKKRVYTEDEKNICLNLFNPRDFNSYTFTVNNWVMAMIDLIDYVNRN